MCVLLGNPTLIIDTRRPTPVIKTKNAKKKIIILCSRLVSTIQIADKPIAVKPPA